MEKALRKHLPKGKFVGVTPQRSRAMAAVRGKGNATTEKRLRYALVRTGIGGWRLNAKDVLGKPDFFFSEAELAVFVDGCFWHGCPSCGHIPSKNKCFWKAKIERNSQRDHKITETLETKGFRVLRFWEHELRDDLPVCVGRIADVLEMHSG